MRTIGLATLLLFTACATLPQPSLAPCTIDEVAGDVRCGTLSVPENRAASGGRTIPLRIVILAARGAATRDPIFILQGGPGQAASTLAEFYARTYDGARDTRDIVLVDQRGTGASNGLHCRMTNDIDGVTVIGEMFPPENVRRCLDEARRHADVAHYGTADAVLDLEDVRRALGYEALNLYGTSYGTRVAIEYARRFPRRVRTLTLKGSVPPSVVVSTAFGRDSQRSLDLLFDDCAADRSCGAAFPALRTEFDAVLRRLRESPVAVRLSDVRGATGEVLVRITPGLFATVTRSLLQSTGSAAELPLLIHEAAGGDFAPFARLAARLRLGAEKELSYGMTFAVSCSEDSAAAALAADAGEGTFLGTYWRDQLVAACGVWGNSSVTTHRQPLRSELPTLLISGTLDPATPPSYAEELRAQLPNSLHVEVRNGSHSFSGMTGCIDRIMVDFVSKGTVTGLDRACAAAIKRPPFVVSRSK
ncbi:MAG TPA: alpha/beta hydrolase [Thermoanaerobaculia bacterium]|nr:alpha/beta hydrolase [Thermoanaerobaculia bacterium]